MRVLAVIGLVLVLAGCGKSDSVGTSALSHPIVGSWLRAGDRHDLMFNSNRTGSETKIYAPPTYVAQCTLSANFTYDISDTALTFLFTGVTMSDVGNCEAVCQSLVAKPCAQAVFDMYPFIVRSSPTTASVSGSTLSINGAAAYTRN